MKYKILHNQGRPVKLEERLKLEHELQQKYLELSEKMKPKEQDEWKKFNRKLEKAVLKVAGDFKDTVEVDLNSIEDVQNLINDYGCITFAPEKNKTVIYVYDLVGENYAANFVRTTEKKEDGSTDSGDYHPRVYIAAGIENASGRPKSERRKRSRNASEQLDSSENSNSDEGSERRNGNS